MEATSACAASPFNKVEAATETANRPNTDRRLDWETISGSSFCCARTATTILFPEAPQTLLLLLLLWEGTRVLDDVNKAPSKTAWEAPRRPAIDATAFAISPFTTNSELRELKTELETIRASRTECGNWAEYKNWAGCGESLHDTKRNTVYSGSVVSTSPTRDDDKSSS
jgi:hypothetical protein